MIRIVIESALTQSRSGVSQRTHQPYTMVSQDALLFKEHSKYPDKIVLDLPDGQKAYDVGSYVLGDDSYQSDKYRKLTFSRSLQLIPLPHKSSAVA